MLKSWLARINKLILFLFFVITLGILYGNFSRLNDAKGPQEKGAVFDHPSAITPVLFDKKKWMIKDWTEDDKPFYKLRQDIDKMDAGQLIEVIDTYWAATEKTDTDFLSLFGWAYASYQARTFRVPDAQYRFAYANRYIVLNSVKLPSCYEWARLRFLMTVPISKDSDYKKLGLRLLQHEPKDSTVKYFMLGVTDLREPDDKKLTLKYIDELLVTEPVKVSTYTAIGWVYFKLMNIEKNLDYGPKAVAAYEEFLNKAPQNHEFRPRAVDLIKSVKEEMEILRSSKNGKPA